MSSSSAYLVTGATGAQGGAVARALLKAGQRVHALVRDPAKPEAKELEKLGAVLFTGDFDDVEGIKKATVGVKGVFINPYPTFTDPTGEGKQAQRFVDAAREAGTVESLVISTVQNTDKHAQWVKEVPDYPMKQYYESKSSAEDAVRNSGIKYWTVLRPPWLFHNYTTPHNRFLLRVAREREPLSAVRAMRPKKEIIYSMRNEPVRGASDETKERDGARNRADSAYILGAWEYHGEMSNTILTSNTPPRHDT